MHNLDYEHPTRPGFEPSTSAFRATTGPNQGLFQDVFSGGGGCLEHAESRPAMRPQPVSFDTTLMESAPGTILYMRPSNMRPSNVI